MDTLKLPELDLSVLEEKAKESAMKGAIKEIEEYYTGYNSPFRKKIKEDLESKTTTWAIDLPDIIGLINDALGKEVDRIANNCIAESFVPLASKALTRADKEIKFSEILNQFNRYCNSEFKDGYRPEVDVEKHREYDWLNVKIAFTDYCDKSISYDFTLHTAKDGKYQLLSLPTMREPYGYSKIIKLSNGEGSIEMPFTRDCLKDDFTAYLASLIICNSQIEMDTTDFNDEYDD